ncbi:MAG: ribosome recycling factor [Candidatus Latescibacteria bacterium]|nr:ribosome recycling factor [Candidatus Latescibacterota bacterium]
MDKEIKKQTVEHMEKAIEHLNHELSQIRTGRASTTLLDMIKVDYFGAQTPLKHVANISVPDAKTIMIQPFQPNILQNIEKAIHASDLGLTPNSDGHVIRLMIPQPTEERRLEIIKIVKKNGEDTKVSIRNIRREAIEKLRAAEKAHELPEDDRHRGEKETQELTDKYTSKIDEIVVAKEEEVMTV